MTLTNRERAIIHAFDDMAREDAMRDIGDRDTEPSPPHFATVRPFAGCFLEMLDDSERQVRYLHRAAELGGTTSEDVRAAAKQQREYFEHCANIRRVTAEIQALEDGREGSVFDGR